MSRLRDAGVSEGLCTSSEGPRGAGTTPSPSGHAPSRLLRGRAVVLCDQVIKLRHVDAVATRAGDGATTDIYPNSYADPSRKPFTTLAWSYPNVTQSGKATPVR